MTLDADTISASVWEVVSGDGLVIGTPASDFTENTTRFWASEGVAGRTYKIKNHITTTGGREYERTRSLKVKEL